MDVAEDSAQNLDPQPGWIRRYCRFNEVFAHMRQVPKSHALAQRDIHVYRFIQK